MIPKISVLVPVYNTEKYIKKCIDSIKSQTITDWELILVDDGSTDDSGKICDEYAKQDEKITVYHKKNEGISATREFAVQHANGTYIQFVDSDDWIDADMLERMYGAAQAKNLDVVGCNFIEEYTSKSVRNRRYYVDKEPFLRDVIASNWGVLWKILFKKSLLLDNDIHFPKGIDGGEDYYVVTNILLAAQNIKCIDFYPYHYRLNNSTSFISTPSFKKIQYQITATSLVVNKLKEMEVDKLYEKEIVDRKSSIKSMMMSFNMGRGVRTFPEINKWYIKNAYRKKFRLRTLLYMVTHI